MVGCHCFEDARNSKGSLLYIFTHHDHSDNVFECCANARGSKVSQLGGYQPSPNVKVFAAGDSLHDFQFLFDVLNGVCL